MKRTISTLMLLAFMAAATAQNVRPAVPAPDPSEPELMASVTWQDLRAHPAPLPVAGELIPVASSLDSPSRWSIGVETMDRDYAEFSKFRKYVGQTGVGYGRLQSGWAKTEKKKGRYDFAWLDEHIDGLIEEGVRPWVCLCYGNPLYSKHGHDLNAKLFPDGPVMDAWLKYVRATVSRYKGKVSMWEVWNEPDGRKNLDSYPLYANLFVRTAKVIREVDPDVRIAAFGSCSPDREYILQAMELIARQDGVKYIDCLTVHAYWYVPEKVVPAVKKLKAAIAAYSPDIEILQGETGCPAQLEYGHALKHYGWTEYSQAKWDLRQMMNFFGLDMPYSVFTMVDLQYDWMLQSFGLIRMNLLKEPVYKRPKFYAVQHVTSVFTPEVKPDSRVRAICADSGELECVGIMKDGRTVGAVLWFGGVSPTSGLDRRLVDLSLEGYIAEDPVYVDLLTGYVHEIPERQYDYRGRFSGSSHFNGVPLWDSPVLIVERGAVSISSKVPSGD